MPYIVKRKRERLEKAIQLLLDDLLTFPAGLDGNLNFIISKLMWGIWQNEPQYETANELIGVLECAKLEFYRRVIANYENVKIKENGDVFSSNKESNETNQI